MLRHEWVPKTYTQTVTPRRRRPNHRKGGFRTTVANVTRIRYNLHVLHMESVQCDITLAAAARIPTHQSLDSKFVEVLNIRGHQKAAPKLHSFPRQQEKNENHDTKL